MICYEPVDLVFSSTLSLLRPKKFENGSIMAPKGDVEACFCTSINVMAFGFRDWIALIGPQLSSSDKNELKDTMEIEISH